MPSPTHCNTFGETKFDFDSTDCEIEIDIINFNFKILSSSMSSTRNSAIEPSGFPKSSSAKKIIPTKNNPSRSSRNYQSSESKSLSENGDDQSSDFPFYQSDSLHLISTFQAHRPYPILSLSEASHAPTARGIFWFEVKNTLLSNIELFTSPAIPSSCTSTPSAFSKVGKRNQSLCISLASALTQNGDDYCPLDSLVHDEPWIDIIDLSYRDFYRNLFKEMNSLELVEAIKVKVEKDVKRTFGLFQTNTLNELGGPHSCININSFEIFDINSEKLDEKYETSLRVLLSAMCFERGYCQGMNFIAALFLLVEKNNDSNSFILLSYLLRQCHLEMLFYSRRMWSAKHQKKVGKIEGPSRQAQFSVKCQSSSSLSHAHWQPENSFDNGSVTYKSKSSLSDSNLTSNNSNSSSKSSSPIPWASMSQSTTLPQDKGGSAKERREHSPSTHASRESSSNFLYDYIHHFDVAFKKHNKALFSHLQSIGFTSVCFTIEWFTTCFVKSCPGDLCICVLDLVFLGVDDVLIRVALAILDTMQTELLAMDEESIQLRFKDMVKLADPLKVIPQAILINLAYLDKPSDASNCIAF